MILKNKPTYVKILVAAIALLLVACIAVGSLLFAFRDEPTVVSLGATGVTQPMFDYYLASYKYDFLIQYKEDGLRDMGNSWRALSSDGVRTWEERFYDEFEESLARRIAAASLFDASYSLSAKSRDEINERMRIVTDANGGKGKTGELLARYGCDTGDLRRILTLDYKIEMLYTILYGTDGSGLPDGLLEKTYQEEYARVKTVFIRTKAKEGAQELGAEALEDATRRIATLEEYLADGMNEQEFLSLQSQFNEDKEGAQKCPNGFYFSMLLGEEAVNAYGASVIEKAISMKAGEFAMVEGTYGTYLLYRMSNPVGAYAQEANAQWFRNFIATVTARECNRLIDTVLDDVHFDEGLFFEDQVILTPKNYEIVY